MPLLTYLIPTLIRLIQHLFHASWDMSNRINYFLYTQKKYVITSIVCIYSKNTCYNNYFVVMQAPISGLEIDLHLILLQEKSQKHRLLYHPLFCHFTMYHLTWDAIIAKDKKLHNRTIRYALQNYIAAKRYQHHVLIAFLLFFLISFYLGI